MDPAELEGTFWGARAMDWVAVQQRTIQPAFLAVLEELRPWPGRTLLDIGCGAGEFVGMAGSLGAMVSGLDACATFIEIARERIPRGKFWTGDMERIPFPDDEFAVVTAFNSLHLAPNPAVAVAEAVRVARPGGHIVIATWGPPAECDAIAYLLDLGGLMPPQAAEEPVSPDLSDPDALRDLLVDAGLTPSPWRVVPCPWAYADLPTALRGLLSTGPASRAINYSGWVQVAGAISESISPYRRGDGSYLLDNSCYYLVAPSEVSSAPDGRC
jgi:ubiquinone/menaquinone biosynthesis C-methylase UbiE